MKFIVEKNRYLFVVYRSIYIISKSLTHVFGGSIGAAGSGRRRAPCLVCFLSFVVSTQVAGCYDRVIQVSAIRTLPIVFW